LDLLGVGRLPFLSRRSYSNEFQHLLVWSVFAGVVEGQFASLWESVTIDDMPPWRQRFERSDAKKRGSRTTIP